jgi:hypothetical protein
MIITHYSFGTITVEGKTYSKDLIVLPGRIHSPWWRKEGHLLQIEDLSEVITAGLPLLIVGTGYYGTMRVPHEVTDYLNSKNIEVIVEKTADAVAWYNKKAAADRTAAAFHLTC